MPSARRSATSPPHPARRFAAPGAILAGSALKDLIGRSLVELLGESVAAVHSRFDRKKFERRALAGLEGLELKQRGAHLAAALAEQLPADFDETARIVIASFGPELEATEGNGLAPFFYYPHSFLIAEHGPARFEAGMEANYALTKRFTAEFSIRPFLVEHPDRSLRTLDAWTADPNPHVRRLVSEGSRPRLPWAMRLRAFQADPRLGLGLLEKLKDDPERYVQRSVANHLADILKDHPEAAYATCERWLDELKTAPLPPAGVEARRWLIRHAVRLPAKKNEPRALRIRRQAAAKRGG